MSSDGRCLASSRWVSLIMDRATTPSWGARVSLIIDRAVWLLGPVIAVARHGQGRGEFAGLKFVHSLPRIPYTTTG